MRVIKARRIIIGTLLLVAMTSCKTASHAQHSEARATSVEKSDIKVTWTGLHADLDKCLVRRGADHGPLLPVDPKCTAMPNDEHMKPIVDLVLRSPQTTTKRAATIARARLCDIALTDPAITAVGERVHYSGDGMQDFFLPAIKQPNWLWLSSRCWPPQHEAVLANLAVSEDGGENTERLMYFRNMHGIYVLELARQKQTRYLMVLVLNSQNGPTIKPLAAFDQSGEITGDLKDVSEKLHQNEDVEALTRTPIQKCRANLAAHVTTTGGDIFSKSDAANDVIGCYRMAAAEHAGERYPMGADDACHLGQLGTALDDVYPDNSMTPEARFHYSLCYLKAAVWPNRSLNQGLVAYIPPITTAEYKNSMAYRKLIHLCENKDRLKDPTVCQALEELDYFLAKSPSECRSRGECEPSP